MNCIEKSLVSLDSDINFPELSVVVIGRNEGERKERSRVAWEWAQQQDIRLNISRTIEVYREFLGKARSGKIAVGKDFTDAPLQFSYTEASDREIKIASS